MASDYKSITKYNTERLGTDLASRTDTVCMYSDYTHFIYEILQNADDYKASEISFTLTENELIIEHNGIPFTEENVKAISYFGKSTSRDDVLKVGRFGLGFKAVFTFTATPFVYSGDESFMIFDLYKIRSIPKPNDIESGRTRIVLPFNHEEVNPVFVYKITTKKDAFERIEKRLKTLDKEIILFTSNLMSIVWSTPDTHGNYSRIDTFNKSTGENFAQRQTILEANEIQSEFLVFSLSMVYEGVNLRPVEIAYKQNKDGVIIPVIRPISVLFHTCVESHMGIILNAPFKTNPARETIFYDDEFNLKLIESVISLIEFSLLSLKSEHLLNPQTLSCLPIDFDLSTLSPFTQKLFNGVKQIFLKNELIPTFDGDFTSCSQGLLARGGWLRKVFNPSQLKFLFETKKIIYWVSNEITQTNPKNLWTYFNESLKILEVDPDKIFKKISFDFLTKQSDEWFINLYSQLGLQSIEELLKNTIYNIELIKLQNDQLVKPFDDQKMPNAYLPIIDSVSDLSIQFSTVKKTLLCDENRLLFFENKLKYHEPDSISVVLEYIIPKYQSTNSSLISNEEYNQNFKSIVNALGMVDARRREILVAQLKATPFIRAYNPNTSELRMLQPENVYINDPILLTYFKGFDEFFVIPDDSLSEFASLLGINVFPKRLIEIAYDYIVPQNSKTNREVKCRIVNFKFHGFDNFLSNLLNSELFQQKHTFSLALWELLIRGLKKVGSVERLLCGHYFYKYRKYIDDFFPSHALELLRSVQWVKIYSSDILYRPSEIHPKNLDDSYEACYDLVKILGFNESNISEEAAKILLQEGLDLEDITLLNRFKAMTPDYKSIMEEQIRLISFVDVFDERSVEASQRRQSKITEEYLDSPERVYEKKLRKVRISKPNKDPGSYLENCYTSLSDDKMGCQMCRQEMPFKKKDNTYYYEIVNIFDDHKYKEHQVLHLAFCPNCAAKYRELVKKDEAQCLDFERVLTENRDTKICINLNGKEGYIHFTQQHRNDIGHLLILGLI
jgi:hypothetical protein